MFFKLISFFFFVYMGFLWVSLEEACVPRFKNSSFILFYQWGLEIVTLTSRLHFTVRAVWSYFLLLFFLFIYLFLNKCISPSGECCNVWLQLSICMGWEDNDWILIFWVNLAIKSSSKSPTPLQSMTGHKSHYMLSSLKTHKNPVTPYFQCACSVKYNPEIEAWIGPCIVILADIVHL